MNYNAWFEHFKEQLQGLTKAFESSGSPLSLLAFALKNQKIDSETYLAWATEFYKLPKLQSRFFTETPVSQEMFAKWATHYPWSSECLPVAEWDGAIIVACLHPPQDFPTNPACAFVLADYHDLVKCWDLLHKKEPIRQVGATLSEVEFPQGMELTVTSATALKKTSSFVADELRPADSESDSESPVGLFSEATTVDLKAFNKDLPTVETPKVPKVTSAVLEKPAIAEQTVVTEEPTAKGAAQESSDLLFLDETPPTIPAVSPDAARTFNAAPVAAQMPTPPPSEKTSSGVFEEQLATKPVPLTPRPTGVAKPTMNPVATGQFSLEKIKKKNSSLLSENIKSVFTEMKTYFEKAMVLTLDDDETQLMAFAWDENFQSMKDTSVRFPLKTPSIFNIVASTQKPFHGYISLNEINEKFFDDWNQNNIPDHVTIVPILAGEKLVGMLMGLGEKSAYNRASLQLAERLSVDLMKGFEAA
ncbi:MAG: hypothetical protein HUU57_09795 [Bdellovibrio sp.]|nr:hypothetical protein [Bdellovibrio sp.]